MIRIGDTPTRIGRCGRAIRSGGDPLAALGPSSVDNEPSGFCRHPRPESVTALANAIAWLKCPFHCKSPICQPVKISLCDPVAKKRCLYPLIWKVSTRLKRQFASCRVIVTKARKRRPTHFPNARPFNACCPELPATGTKSGSTHQRSSDRGRVRPHSSHLQTGPTPIPLFVKPDRSLRADQSTKFHASLPSRRICCHNSLRRQISGGTDSGHFNPIPKNFDYGLTKDRKTKDQTEDQDET